MKFTHPEFGRVEATVEEFLKLNSIEKQYPTSTKTKFKKEKSVWKEEEILDLLEDQRLPRNKVIKRNKAILKNHTMGSFTRILYLLKNGNTDQMSGPVKRAYKKWSNSKVVIPRTDGTGVEGLERNLNEKNFYTIDQ